MEDTEITQSLLRDLIKQHPYRVLAVTFIFYIVAMLMNVTQDKWLWPAVKKWHDNFTSDVIYYSQESDVRSISKVKRDMRFVSGVNMNNPERKFRTSGWANSTGYWEPVRQPEVIHEHKLR